MSSSVVTAVLSRLHSVKSSRDGWTARCPAHDDHVNSLSITEGDDGRVLLKCFAGCSIEAIVEALGLTVRDLFPRRDQRTSPVSALTVDQLAEDKELPVEFLRSLGLEDRSDGVLIPYAEMDGSPASRHRLRTSTIAKEGSIWLFGKGKPVPYGLHRVKDARDAGYTILVEGESDCWTLWHHGLPALGIPGAGMTGKLEADHVSGVRRIYVFQEPDDGGREFVNGVTSRLSRLRWQGSLFTVSLDGVKDPNALHQADPAAFKTTFQKALDCAAPLELPEPKETTEPKLAGDVAGLLAASGVSALTGASSPADVKNALCGLASLVRDADEMDRAMAREFTMKHLSGFGFRAPAKLVDAALGPLRAARSDGLSGQSLLLSDPEPWPEPVDADRLLEDLVETLKRHVVLPPSGAITIALWILHCYVFDALWISPFLTITSPQKRCGKSTLLILISALVPRSLLASNISPAAVYRAIDQFHPSLLVDEGDTSLVNNDELRGILNAGHTRDTAIVVRSVGDQHESRTFSTWCPKAIALIGQLRDTLEDRSIIIQLKRKTKAEKVSRLPRKQLRDECEPLRQQAARWADEHREQIGDADPHTPESLHDRAQDNWAPLLAIADAVGGEWPERARGAALSLSDSDEEGDGSVSVQLLADIRDLFREHETDRMASAEVVKALQKMEDRPWPEWRRGQPLTATGLAKLLKPFRVRPRTIRTGQETVKGYARSDFGDAFGRYLPAEPSHRNNGGISSDSDESQPSQDDECDGTESDQKARNDALVTGVTVRNTDSGERVDCGGPPEEEFEV